MKLKLIFVIGLVGIILAACGAPSVNDLKEDQALLQKTMAKCMTMPPEENQKDQACINARLAMQEIQKNMMGNLMNMMGK